MRASTLLAMVVTAIAGFTACGGKNSPSAPSTAPPPPATPTGTYVNVAPTTVGTVPNNNVGNTLPFGGVTGNFPATTYQQVYSAGQFGTAALRISGVDFFMVPSPSRPNPVVTPAQYTFSLSSTAAQVDALNTTVLSANVGANNTVVFSGPLASTIVDNVLNIVFTAPFVYTPTSGNLLLQILRSNPGQSNFIGFVNHLPNDGYTPGLASRAHDYGVGFAGIYLVTRFHHQRCQCPTAAPCSC